MVELFNIIPKSVGPKSTNIHNVCRCGMQEVSAGPNQVRVPLTYRYPPHKTTRTPDTISKGADTKNKTWQTSEGGFNLSASCNTGGNKSHVPDNSNHNAKHVHTRWRWTVTLVPGKHSCVTIHRGNNKIQGFNAVKRRRKQETSIEMDFQNNLVNSHTDLQVNSRKGRTLIYFSHTTIYQ